VTGPDRAGDTWACSTCGTPYLFHLHAQDCCQEAEVKPVVIDLIPRTIEQAIPARYEVRRTGTPDPETSRYVVLDIVHDWSAREALRRLVNLYLMVGATTHAQELERFLDATQPAARAVIDIRNEQLAPKKRKRRI